MIMKQAYQIFADAYLCGASLVDAARKARPKTARENSLSIYANRLMKNPEVQAYIRGRQEKLNTEAELTAQWVIERLMREARGNVPDTTQAGRVRALELLAKKLELFPAQRMRLTDAEGKDRTLAFIVVPAKESYDNGSVEHRVGTNGSTV